MKKFIKSYFKMFLIFFLAFSTAMGASYKLFEGKSKREAAVKVQESKTVASEKVATTTEEQPKQVVEETRQTTVSKVAVVSSTVQTVKPTATATTTTQPTEVAKVPTMNIYSVLNLDINKIIKNSDKYVVNLDKTENVKVGDNIKYTVKNTAKQMDCIKQGECYGSKILSGNNGQWIDNNTYQSTIVIQNFDTPNNTIQAYIFILPNGDSSIYEYDFTLNK